MSGQSKPLMFQINLGKARRSGVQHRRNLMVWTSAYQDLAASAVRIEDGFLQSKGLGARLTPPLLLVTDQLGIYYDPRQPSQLEQLIAASVSLRPNQRNRSENLRPRVTTEGLTKYNGGQTAPSIVGARRILVPRQVEDDASIITDAGEICTNLALLTAVRRANPDAIVLYNPHPDVMTGLSRGVLPDQQSAAIANRVLGDVDPASLLTQAEEVWAMTSLLGFEALLRNKVVVTYWAPFYADWG